MTARRPRPPITLFAKLACASWYLVDKYYGQTMSPVEAIEHARCARRDRSMRASLGIYLGKIAYRYGCSVDDLRFDHEPALRLRKYNPRIKDIAARYTPNANDPSALIIRPQPPEYEGSHHIKTNVRGDHGQYSDVALIKRERRRERKAKQNPFSGPLVGPARRNEWPTPKTKWPKQKLRSRSNWPKGRKMGKRK